MTGHGRNQQNDVNIISTLASSLFHSEVNDILSLIQLLHAILIAKLCYIPLIFAS